MARTKELSTSTKRWIMLLSGILGILTYFLLPASYKIFSFLIPAIGLSFSFSKAGFNYPILILIGIVFLIFPASFITLDAETPYNIDLIQQQNLIDNTIGTLTGVFCVGLPTLLVIGGIWALVSGNVEGGVGAIGKAIVVCVILGVFITVFRWAGIPLGPLEQVADITDWITKEIAKYTEQFQDQINDYNDTASGDATNRGQSPEDVANESTTNFLAGFFNDAKRALKTGWPWNQDAQNSNQNIRLALIGSFPLNLALFNIIIALFSYFFKFELPKLDFDKPNRISRPSAVNYEFLIFLAIILVGYFTYYLAVDETIFLSYRNLGYFTIYLVIITASCIILAFGLGSVVKTNWNTLLGILFGNVSLFVLFNLFTQEMTLDAMSLEYTDTSQQFTYIIVQFMCVAPAESFLFHVFIPALCLSMILLQIKRYNKQSIDKEINQKRREMTQLQLENEYYKVSILKPKTDYKNDKGNINDYVDRIEQMDRLNNQIAELERTKEMDIEPNSKYLSTKQKAVFVVVVVISNFLFSLMHWFRSGLEIRIFFSSGLFLIYFLSGIIITTIAFRYGWLAGILTHAINNTAQIFLILIIGLV